MFNDNLSSSYVLFVPSVNEIEAPLGGTSVLYTITLIEGQESLHVEKTFREIELFAQKLGETTGSKTKIPSLNCPLNDVVSRKASADFLMKFITENSESIPSDVIKHLLGFENALNFPVIMKKATGTNPTVTKTTDIQKESNSNDLFMEFKNANKLTKQQKGRTSFFDDSDEDDDDLFGNANNSVRKANPGPPETEKIEEEVGLSNNNLEDSPAEEEEEDFKTDVTKLDETDKHGKSGNNFGEDEEEEIDDSVLRLDEDIDNLDHLLKPKASENPKPPVKAKPVPPPKRPGLTAKPIPPPKPGQPKQPEPNLSTELDINRYINLEEAANSEEVKLFD